MRPLGPQIPAQHPALERKDAYNGRIRFYGLRDRLKTLVNPRHRRVIRHYVKQMLVLSLGSVDAKSKQNRYTDNSCLSCAENLPGPRILRHRALIRNSLLPELFTCEPV